MKSRRPRRFVAGVVSVALVAALGALGTTSASAASPPDFTGPGIGPQPKGLGMGSKAALAQDNCNANGRTSFALEGSGPFCVNPWSEGDDNGGATAQGVTADSVKVVIYIENQQQAAGGSGSQAPVNQATKQTGTVPDAIRDTLEEFDHAQEALQTYQTWGRTIDFQVFEATGADEAAQNADATAIAAMEPFLVYDQTKWATGGAPVLAAALAAKKIVTVSASTTPDIGEQQDPYRWANAADDTASAPLTAFFVGRSLAGEKAKWAGDEDMQSETRVFGIVYPTADTFDFASFQPQLTDAGGPKLAAEASFDPDDPQAADTAPISIQRMKDAGVTSVILFAPGPLVGTLMTVANDQEYHPEWVFTGFGYQDYDGFARTFPQDQMESAFGLSILWPYADPEGRITDGFRWYWGLDQGTYSTTIPAVIGFVYASVQYAGPTLTAKNVRKGWFSVPATKSPRTGQSGYGYTTGMPYPEYAASGTDRALAFWDGEPTANTQAGPPVGQGVFQYVDGGTRYTLNTMPTKEPKFFDMKGAVYEVPFSANYSDGVVPDATPCEGCPSSGGTGGAA